MKLRTLAGVAAVAVVVALPSSAGASSTAAPAAGPNPVQQVIWIVQDAVYQLPCVLRGILNPKDPCSPL